ncbi:LOW QUALITY PROTEIN: hypothetical protein TorRG33x02_203980 [Trema orientale]|uniref:Transmembrane protein n=1 Tax=Trema orientale TaxID=63057 RepID=A0A2P5EE82_TREOI|nr:LOW QUALITY PROTEIN: hypothetical protein TorRG33x02_203980 [Trema orientale]
MSSLFLFKYKFLLLKDVLKDLLEHMSFFHKKPKLVIVFITIVWFVGKIFVLFTRYVYPQAKPPTPEKERKSLRMSTPTPWSFSSSRLKPSGANS